MIAVRRARPSDAPLIGAVHVAAWRSAYPGILPEDYLAGLSVTRQAAFYDRQIRAGAGVYVAIASGQDVPRGDGPRVVGYTTVGRSTDATLPSGLQADGEIETLYVLDDWRERGVGRRLIRTGAAHLAAAGSRTAFLWVLRNNPSRWFYQRLGGRPVAESDTRVAGVSVPQTAYAWDPIERLIAASPAT
ncbi:GNAT family N-acetyltransferase [Acidisphaera sp. L21]|uniref:GNAT family N-acetyltransferase n=1 Tax=Acidisphaera sp. L21 TaxID=1641851 RepID=UPI00131A789A|nr:GNAT family N-acetyltransferase [Acidisphaera sp. L21]